MRTIQAWYCDGLAGAHAQARRSPCAACGTAGRLLHAPVVLHAGCFALHAVVSRCTLRVRAFRALESLHTPRTAA